MGRIVDSAHMIDPTLARHIDSDLEFEAQRSKVPILIETVESLGGQTIQDVVKNKSFAPGTDGIYVLLAKKDRKIEVHVAFRFQNLIDDAEQKAIRQAFIEGLRRDGAEAGISQGVRAITRVLRSDLKEEIAAPDEQAKAREPQLEPAPVVTKSDSPLVVRDQVKLALSGARRIIEVAEAKARTMGLKVNIAVVDDGGHLLSFARMDGARPASGYTAMTKATTAATFRQETGPLPRGAASPDPLLNLSLQNAAAASGGKVTTLFGGVPVLIDGQVIGAVGVGGGTGEQDATVAKAGIEALLNDLKRSSPTTSEATDPTRE